MQIINKIKTAHQNVAVAILMAMGSSLAMAAEPAWLTTDQSGGKTLNDVSNNVKGAATTIADLIVTLVTIGGFMVVAFSLYQLYKASKDEREKPTSAVVGLFVGGAMAAVGPIMWIMKGTITG